ncbi:MAG: HEPN domain-containing protein [Candidatus Rokubacteria bacterium]|nr:HEPN domain-containing protein [Candidatus Rokubacteria bacterium]
MLTTLTAVVERLVRHYDPDRIILFGSHATGGAEPDSDIDLLVVKDTDQRPIDRRAEVERLLADRAVPLDVLVYTRREMRDLYALGSPFIEEVVEHGRVLYTRRATEAWLREAQEELESAAILLEREKHRAACLHGQQCVERALKALLLERGRRPPRGHDVVELLNAVTAAGWQVGLAMDDAVFLNSIYRGRYPTEEGLLPHGEATAKDARRAVGAAAAALRDVRAILQAGAP